MSTPFSEMASCDLPASRPACLDLSTCPYTADPAFATVAPLATMSPSSLPLNFFPAGSLDDTGPSSLMFSTVPAGTDTFFGAATAAAAGTAAAAPAGAAPAAAAPAGWLV